MRTTPVDLILHDLADRLRELPDDDHHVLASAIAAHCVDPRAVADQWTHGTGTAQAASWCVQRIRDEGACGKVSAETRAMEVAIARRLADVGLSLLVTQDAEDRAAATLLLDASRLVVGLERAQEANLGPVIRAIPDSPPPVYRRTDTRIEELTEENATFRRWLSEVRAVVGLPEGPNYFADVAEAVREHVREGVEHDAIVTRLKAQHHEEVARLRRDIDRLIAEKAVARDRLDACAKFGPEWKATLDAVMTVVDHHTCDGLANVIAKRIADLRVDVDRLTAAQALLASQHSEEVARLRGDIDRLVAEKMALAKTHVFKVGDRVRFARAVGPESGLEDAPPIGWDGIIREDDKSSLPLRVVGSKWGLDSSWWFVPEALDLVTPA